MYNDLSEYMSEMNKSLAVSKEVKLTLREALEDCTKDRLSKIAALYEVTGRSKMKKGELAEELCKHILDTNKLAETFVTLDKEQEELIEKLIANDFIESTNIPVNVYLNLYGNGILFTYINKENQIFMAMPKEVKESIVKMDKSTLDVEKNRYRLVEQYILAFSNLYGVFEESALLEIFNSQNEEKLTSEEFYSLLNKFMEKSGLVQAYNGKFVHEALLEGVGLDELIAEVEGKEYFVPAKEELLKYSDEFYIEMTPEHTNLKQYLLRLFNNDEEVAQGLFEDLCLALTDDSLSVDDALFELERRDIEIKDRKQLQEYIGAISLVNDNTRKWANRGFTPIEMPAPKQEPIVKEKTIGRNEPCPCGSKKKYKKCCGK